MSARIVLVIEDNPITRKLVRLTLGNEGFTVIEAGDGGEALALTSLTPPDLIIQDLLLPDMDGFELLRRLRAQPEMADVPIIAFSGFLSRLEYGRATAMGFTDFMAKPVEPSRLVQIVRAHLSPELAAHEKAGGGRHVLLVDDDPVQLKLARMRLTGLGFEVSTATDGAEALDLLQQGGTEAVVSDVLMPQVDGFSLCVAMRKVPHLADVPVILVSSNYVEEADRQVGRAMGATAFVVRTPDLAGVIQALDTALNAPSNAPLASVPPEPAEPAQHHERVLRQLERQAALNAGLAHQSAMHASMLSVVAGISESLTKRHSVDGAGPDILASLLEASGVSVGALFMRGAHAVEPGAPALDDLVLRAQIGFAAGIGDEVGTFFGHRDIFERAVAAKSPLVVSATVERSAEQELLARAGMKSALLVPCVADEECLGLFLLASKTRDLTEGDWIPFARTIAVQIGQALSLGRAFSTLEHEILERKQAESALRQERDRAQRYLDTADVILLALDLEGRITLINRKGCEVLGWTAGELLGREFIEACVPARIRAETRRKLRDVHGGDDSIVENAIVTRSGNERLIEWRTTFLRDDEGRLASTLSSGTDITERSQAVEALRTAEERMRFALEAAGVGIWDMDPSTQVVQWSETLETQYGLQPGTFGGTFAALVERIHPDDRESVLEVVGTAMTSGADFSVQNRLIWPDGTVRWLSGAGRFHLGEHGEPERGVGISLDITERKHAERAQQASEARYRTLFEYAPDGIVIADRESYYIDANPSMCRMLGYSRDEFIGLHASDIVSEAEIQHIGPALREIAATSDYHRQWRFRRKDGSVFPAEVMATTMPDGNLLGMIRDVTARNQAIEALRTAEERMRFALQSADVGIWDMDYATGVLRWSETIEAHYGLKPGTFGGTFEAFVERIHPDDRASVLETFAKATKSGSDFSIQSRSIWPDGTVRWLSGAGRVVIGEHGEPVRGVGISLDVTERNTLEEQFQQAQKMEAVGRLAGGVAHDFNNLLTVILGFCELLLADRDPDDPRTADIAEIQKAGTHAAGLTRQLLAFSRKQIIEPTLLDLNGIVADMRPMLGRLIGEDVKVMLDLRPELALVKADRGQVEQVVMNLAVNARDAMPKGGTLTIETANVELDEHYAKMHLAVKPGPYVGLTMTDTGTGMTPQVQARLFEPFFTTKEPGKGTGLGMATVYGIVTRSGGNVGVYSEVGKGTAFKVYFPRADASEKVADAPARMTRTQAGTQTVLVVDDEDGLRELAKRLLERQGYTVLVAANADGALQLFERHSCIDVLLTDVVMPGASGPELTRQLVDQRPGLKVIYMSGYTEDAIIQHGVLKPGIAFLNKPFTSQTLGAKIHEVLDR